MDRFEPDYRSDEEGHARAYSTRSDAEADQIGHIPWIYSLFPGGRGPFWPRIGVRPLERIADTPFRVLPDQGQDGLPPDRQRKWRLALELQPDRQHFGGREMIVGAKKALRGSVLIAVAFLGACSHQVATTGMVLDQSQVFSPYKDKIPGSFAIYVQTGTWSRDIKVNSWTCSAHKFRIDADEQFYQSFTLSLVNLVESGTVVEQPLSQQELRDRGYRAQIAVHAGVLEPSLKFRTGFFSGEAFLKLKGTVQLVVLDPGGVLVQTTVETTQASESGAGWACEGANKAVQEAVGGALADLITRTAERINSLPDLRVAWHPEFPEDGQASKVSDITPAVGTERSDATVTQTGPPAADD